MHDGCADGAAGEMDPEGQATVESLARFQQAKSITAAGSLVRYALSRESVTVLQEATGGLYGWQHPGLPDNLCLYRGDGSPWLVSSAGLHIGYLEVSPFEKLLIGRTAPGLIAVLAHQSARDAILAYMERRFESNVASLTDQLTEYAHIVIGDGREGLVDALEDWMRSGEEARISAALEVARALRLVELRDTVARCCARACERTRPRRMCIDRCPRSGRGGASPAGVSSSASSASCPEGSNQPPEPNWWATSITAGPSRTMNSVGKMHPTMGKSILSGAFWPCSSAR